MIAVIFYKNDVELEQLLAADESEVNYYIDLAKAGELCEFKPTHCMVHELDEGELRYIF